MKKVVLDQIPALVESKKLSWQEACMQIYITLYNNPGRFNLLDMSDDNRSDFLLNFLQYKTENLLQNYNPDIAPFGAYIYFTIQSSKLTFLKKLSDQKVKDNLFRDESAIQYSEQIEDGVFYNSEVAESIPAYIPQSKEDEIPQLVYKKLFTKHRYRLSVKESQQRKLRQGLLILALKSAWYINDEQINKVSRVCEISPHVITDSICKLKANLITKSLCRREIENNRNKAYCFIKKYKEELENISDKNSPIFKIINRKLNYQEKNFRNKNCILQTGKFKISPSNLEISTILGISEKLISCYLSRFKALDLTKIENLKIVNE